MDRRGFGVAKNPERPSIVDTGSRSSGVMSPGEFWLGKWAFKDSEARIP